MVVFLGCVGVSFLFLLGAVKLLILSLLGGVKFAMWPKYCPLFGRNYLNVFKRVRMLLRFHFTGPVLVIFVAVVQREVASMITGFWLSTNEVTFPDETIAGAFMPIRRFTQCSSWSRGPAHVRGIFV